MTTEEKKNHDYTLWLIGWIEKFNPGTTIKQVREKLRNSSIHKEIKERVAFR